MIRKIFTLLSLGLLIQVSCGQQVLLQDEKTGRTILKADAVEALQIQEGNCWVLSILAGEAARVQDRSLALQLLIRGNEREGECIFGPESNCDAALIVDWMAGIEVLFADQGSSTLITSHNDDYNHSATLSGELIFLDHPDNRILKLIDIDIISSQTSDKLTIFDGLALRAPDTLKSWNIRCGRELNNIDQPSYLLSRQ